MKRLRPEAEQMGAAFERFAFGARSAGETHLTPKERVFGNWGNVPDEELTITTSLRPRVASRAPRLAISLELRMTIFVAHRFACLYCGEPAVEIDHIMPRSRGGNDEPDNLAPACWSCNNAKRSQYLWVWLRLNPGIDAVAIRERWRSARGEPQLPGMGA